MRVLPAVLLAAGLLQSQTGDDLARAMSLAAQGRFAEAEQLLRGIETTYPDQFQVRYRLGLILLRQGNAREAAMRFEAATKQSPNSALAWLGLAQARLRLDQRDAALQAAEQAARLGKTEPPVWRGLTMVYASAHEFGRAADFEERWSRSPNADPDSPLRHCRFRISAGDKVRVLEVCRQAATTRDSSSQMQQLLGDAYRVVGDALHAVEAYQRAIALDPADASGYLKLVALFLDHRTPLPAITILENATARFPKHAELRRSLGLAFYQTGDFDKALQQFLAVVDIDPDSEAGYASFETLLPMAGPRLPEIVARLRGFRERRPKSPVGHFLLARALAAGEGTPSAEIEALLRQAVQADSEFWPAHYELAQLEQTDAAIRSLTHVVKLNPEHAQAHYTLAQLYARKGDRVRSVEHRKKHHALLDRERARAERARAESPALSFSIESR